MRTFQIRPVPRWCRTTGFVLTAAGYVAMIVLLIVLGHLGHTVGPAVTPSPYPQPVPTMR